LHIGLWYEIKIDKMKKALLTVFTLVAVLCLNLEVSAQKETRNVDEFTKISFGISGNLYLKQGNTQSVVLEGDDLDEIETDVSGGKLRIRKEGRGWGWGDNKIDVYITVRKLEGLDLSGSGKIIGESKFETSDLDLSVSGSGNLRLDVFADNIESGISGSGSMELKGVTGSHRVSISGSGRLSAEDMEAETYKISISGSGSCRINVTKEIDASVSGSGNITYSGNPDRINHQSSGSGRIKKI
jgi:hypothetical protein